MASIPGECTVICRTTTNSVCVCFHLDFSHTEIFFSVTVVFCVNESVNQQIVKLKSGRQATTIQHLCTDTCDKSPFHFIAYTEQCS